MKLRHQNLCYKSFPPTTWCFALIEISYSVRSLEHRLLCLVYSWTDHDDIVSVFLNYCVWKFQIHSSAFNTLGIFRLDRLFDYGNLLEDTDAVNLINRYYSNLMHFVQPKLQNLNQEKEGPRRSNLPLFYSQVAAERNSDIICIIHTFWQFWHH